MPSIKYQFQSNDLAKMICGVADDRLNFIEKLLKVKLIPRDSLIQIESEEINNINLVQSFFNDIEQFYLSTNTFRKNKKNNKSSNSNLKYKEDNNYTEDLNNWEQLYESILNKLQNLKDIPNKTQESIFITSKGIPVFPKGPRQLAYIESIFHNPVTICIGAAGTGKTFLSIACACKLLLSGKRNQLIITRPAVEAGESLGFLPGDLEQKIDPYLRPLYDSLYECLSRKLVNEMIFNRQIEIAPLAYMRGRTLNDAVVILDESQNCTVAQLKMFLTRIGRNTSMCVSGDVTQVDLAPGESGLTYVTEILSNIPEIGIIYFQNEDVIRNPIVKKIINAFEKQN